MAAPEADILLLFTKLGLTAEVDKYRSKILKIQVRTLEFGFFGLGSEVESVVGAFTKDGLAR